jgi:hypothetical protein
MLQTIDHFKISCLRAPFSWLEKPRNHMGWDLDCMADVLMGFHPSTFSKRNTEFISNLFKLCDDKELPKWCKRPMQYNCMFRSSQKNWGRNFACWL